MTTTPTITTSPVLASPSTAAAETTGLLNVGAAAGPLFLGASLLQALLRPGFDLTRNAVSSLSLGNLGWLQDLNFAAAGVLSLVGAVGARRALAGRAGGTWLPRLFSVVGVGLAAASVFHPDPNEGFPPGTPLDVSATSNWHGVLHMVCGFSAFLAIIAACFVFARVLAGAHRRSAAVGARIAGAIFIVALPLSGGHDGPAILFTGVSIGWLAVTACTVQLARDLRRPAWAAR